MKILGIAGSLRQGSYNRSVLRAAQTVLPTDCFLEVFDLEGIPLLNQDDEMNLPKRVVEFKTAIRRADAILIATPEYNFSVPGVLKNAIDWASRPFGDSAWTDKPAAIMGASPDELGPARAQSHLRQILGSLDVHTVNEPEVVIANAATRFDVTGTLVDQTSIDLIRQLLQRLAAWTYRLQAENSPKTLRPAV